MGHADGRNAAEGRSRALELLRAVFTNAARVELVAADTQIDDTLTLHFDVDGDAVALSVDGVRVVRGDVERLAGRAPNLRGRFNRVKNAQHLSVSELRERNLPLYWNREWLEAELHECGSYAAVARKHGYPSSTTIASYAKRNFGLDVQGVYDRKRVEVVAEYLRGRSGEGEPVSYLELAARYDVSIATVYRWVKEHRVGRRRKARRCGRGYVRSGTD